MKKRKIVNPGNAAALAFAMWLTLSACAGGGNGETAQAHQQLASVSYGSWRADFPAENAGDAVFSLRITDSVPSPVDSLHFFDSEIPDSVAFSRVWDTGGGTIAVLSATMPAPVPSATETRLRRVLDGAELVHPPGMRRVYLSARSFADIDSVRASASVEPPPEVTHHLTVTYDPKSTDSCLVVRDSVRVNFAVSTSDSLILVMQTASGPDTTVVFEDSTGASWEIFTTVMAMNELYESPGGELLGHARVTSAYVTGAGFYPLSRWPQNYLVTFSLPDSITAWTPLEQSDDGVWRPGPRQGGVIGGLPFALGRYSDVSEPGGYGHMVLAGSPPDPTDLALAETVNVVLRQTLDFASAVFSFVEINNPDGHVVVPVFGGVFYSSGSLEPLGTVDEWPELLSVGETPEGGEILAAAARGLLIQSLKLDPVLSEMLTAWFPLVYHRSVTGDARGTALLREAYLKYYLFNTELLSLGADAAPVIEHSLADPELQGSPLLHYVAGGKGVVVLEYMNSLGLLSSLSDLLQDFTHRSSANYWARIYSSLRFSQRYQELLRNLFYKPGIPQIEVLWKEESGAVNMAAREIQPGEPFGLPLEGIQCRIHLQDTSLVRTTFYHDGSLMVQINPPPGANGPVTAIDLNPHWLIPADFMYRRDTGSR